MEFTIDTMVAACHAALKQDKPQERVANIVKGLVSEPASICQCLGREEKAGIDKLYVSDTLTIINVVWAPRMTLPPHNHNTWAVIGVYEGREDNIFWRRQKNGQTGKVDAAGAKSIGTGEATALGKHLIHSVTNPTNSFTRALHVYGGNFFDIERSEWDPLSLEEHPYSVERTLALFESENTKIEAIQEVLNDSD